MNANPKLRNKVDERLQKLIDSLYESKELSTGYKLALEQFENIFKETVLPGDAEYRRLEKEIGEIERDRKGGADLIRVIGQVIDLITKFFI